MVAAVTGIININRAVLASVHKTYTIRHERWQLHVNEAERNRLFEGLDMKDVDVPE